jgi:hypothetical protein
MRLSAAPPAVPTTAALAAQQPCRQYHHIAVAALPRQLLNLHVLLLHVLLRLQDRAVQVLSWLTEAAGMQNATCEAADKQSKVRGAKQRQRIGQCSAVTRPSYIFKHFT